MTDFDKWKIVVPCISRIFVIDAKPSRCLNCLNCLIAVSIVEQSPIVVDLPNTNARIGSCEAGHVEISDQYWRTVIVVGVENAAQF